MRKSLLLATFILLGFIFYTAAQQAFEEDTFQTLRGDLKITFVGHGSLMFEFNKKIIHVDPVSQASDYKKAPKADLILITHEHGDHFDTDVIQMLRTEKTDLILTEICSGRVEGGTVMKNGNTKFIQSIKIEAIPAYNIQHMQRQGMPYHPKGNGNGYIITFGGKRVYIAGDTENTPEMKALKDIEIAFLPMNIPYTMTPEMLADAARSIMPRILYPYHTGNTDTSQIVELLKDVKEIEIRIREMK